MNKILIACTSIILAVLFCSASTLIAQPVNAVTDWGAVPDAHLVNGVWQGTDNTSAFASAVFQAWHEGRPLLIPSGAYIITDSIAPANSSFPLTIMGEGRGSTFLVNKAGLNKPTFKFSGSQNFLLRDLAVLGANNYPNDAILITSNGSVPSGNAELQNLILCPNGNGIHLDGTDTGSGGISAFRISDIYYWPSGYNGGGQHDASKLQFAILADGSGVVNHVSIDRLDGTGVDKTISGHACIKWNTGSFSSNVNVRNSQVEGIDLKAVDFTKVFHFAIRAVFAEHARFKFTNSRYGTVSVYNPSDSGQEPAIDIVSGAQIVASDMPSDGTLRIDANSQDCGTENASFNTINDAGVFPVRINTIVGFGYDSQSPGYMAARLGSDTLVLKTIKVIEGSGQPSVSAPVGSIYLRTDGGTGTTLYVKESGTGATGWVAK
jgi:hypothetical protein